MLKHLTHWSVHMQAYLSAIIVYLYAQDFKQAEKCYNDCSQYVYLMPHCFLCYYVASNSTSYSIFCCLHLFLLFSLQWSQSFILFYFSKIDWMLLFNYWDRVINWHKCFVMSLGLMVSLEVTTVVALASFSVHSRTEILKRSNVSLNPALFQILITW